MTDNQYIRLIELFDALVECDPDDPYDVTIPTPDERRVLNKLIKRGWVVKVGYSYSRTPEGSRMLEQFL